MRTVVLAPDKFKGSLSAAQVAQHLAGGIVAGLSADEVEVRQVLMADGGEGPVEAALAAVELDGLHPRAAEAEFVLAADVDNALLGESGAAAVYGPQKGVAPGTVTELGVALARWARQLHDARLEADADADRPGAGAAGGVGYAALVLLGAHLEPSIDVVLELTGFAATAAGACVVVTGEGSLDEQSLRGKTLLGVAKAVAGACAVTVAVAGRTTLTRDQVWAPRLDERYTLLDIEPEPGVSMSDAGSLLEQLSHTVVADYMKETA